DEAKRLAPRHPCAHGGWLGRTTLVNRGDLVGGSDGFQLGPGSLPQTVHAARLLTTGAARHRKLPTDLKESKLTDHKIGTREEWLAARERMLVLEKEHTRLGDELALRRR